MKKLLCVITSCIIVLTLFSGCEKKRDILAGTVWVNDFNETLGIEFHEGEFEGLCSFWEMWENEDNNWEHNGFAQRYRIADDKIIITDLSDKYQDAYQIVYYLELDKDCLFLKYSDSSFGDIENNEGVYRRVKSVEAHCERYGLSSQAGSAQ